MFEADDWELDPYAVEVNVFVDEILGVLYTHGGNRSVILSSFNPGICILLSIKLQKYPALFLTDGGKFPVGNNRAGSLQEAVHFAKACCLAGVAVMADPLVLCPRIIQYVKSFGLMCVSHGPWNDDPANAKIQAVQGLDAIIVNRIQLISRSFKTT
ncbi:Glycerophosphocholine phosphodiesterase [Varicellaria rhodocarpa]|nr:Glycerophosphocholine phosphodiesterase [Varicellaria rhodocarpa]